MSARRVVAAAAAAVMVLVLAACGAKLDTVLEVGADGRGSRTMTLTLSTSDRDQYVTGGNAALDASIRKHLPSQLAFSGLSETPGQGGDAGDVTATFTLTFDSLKDYRAKVAALLAANGSTDVPTIDIRIEDSLFLQGVMVDESFGSSDLLAWLEPGLLADGVIGSNASGNVIESGDTVVRAAGREYASSEPISVNQVRDVGMQSVAMRTRLADDGTVTRTIEYAMGADAYATDPDGFDQFMTKATPSGGTLAPGKAVDGVHTWTMTIAVPVEELAKATSQALGGGDASFEVQRSFTQAPPAMQLTVTASADCSSICSPRAGDVRDTLVLPVSWAPADGSGPDGPGDSANEAAYDLRLPAEAVAFTQPVPVRSVRIATQVYPDLTVAQTVVLALPAADGDVGRDFEAMLRGGGNGTSVAVDRSGDLARYTVTFARRSPAALAAAAARAGLSGLGVAAGKDTDDGFFRSHVAVAVSHPFAGWGVADVQSVVTGAGGLSVDDSHDAAGGAIVARLSGWTTAGLVTLGIIAVAVLGLAAAGWILRVKLARWWRTGRAKAEVRGAAAAASMREARERAAAGAVAGAAVTAGAEEWSEADLR